MEKLNMSYSWFINAILNGTINDKFKNLSTTENFCTICMPTGTGKTGVMFYNIFQKIINMKQPLVINISEPILALTEQTFQNLTCIIQSINAYGHKTGIIINSSDKSTTSFFIGHNSTFDIRTNVKNITNFLNEGYDIVLVASCHKSLYKFINSISDFNGRSNVYSYIDESHTISIDLDNDETTKVDVDKLCKLSNGVYAISATPDNNITKLISSYEKSLDENIKDTIHYGVYMKPTYAISNKLIVPPKAYYMDVGEKVRLNETHCFKAMKSVIKSNPNIPHKLLITASDIDQADAIRKGLIDEINNSDDSLMYNNKPCEVFVIHSYGIYTKDGETDSEKMDMVKKIDAYEGNAFVIHIKMLIAGIDIKSLTDAIIYVSDHGSYLYARHIIQTIGRTVRPLDGERGNTINKTYANIFFVFPEENTKGKEFIANLLHSYYGFNMTKWNKENSKETKRGNNDFRVLGDGYTADESDINITDYLTSAADVITNRIKPLIELYLSMQMKKRVAKEIMRACEEFSNKNIKKDFADWLLDDTASKLYNKVSDKLKKYNLEFLE